MQRFVSGLAVILALGTGAAYAATAATVPADAPAGTTGLCKDGSYSSSATKKGACKGHKGVKEWYAAAPAAEEKKHKAEKAKPEAKAEAAAPAATAAASPAAAPSAPAAKPAATPASAAPGGGPGKVWVNTNTKVYHCADDKWYGKTKEGEYMSEADAKAKGNRPERGKSCS